MRDIPDSAFDLVKEFEGFRAAQYDDTGGLPTIGYGHRLLTNDPLRGATMDQHAAEEVAYADLELVAQELGNVLGLPLITSLTDGQWAALLDFTFNEGIGRFEGSTLCALIKTGDMAGAGGQFGRWVYSTINGQPVKLDGLVKRRAAEAALWVS